MKIDVRIKRAHIIVPSERGRVAPEFENSTTRSVRLRLTPHAKKRLGIAEDVRAYVMLQIDKTVTKEG